MVRILALLCFVIIFAVIASAIIFLLWKAAYSVYRQLRREELNDIKSFEERHPFD